MCSAESKGNVIDVRSLSVLFRSDGKDVGILRDVSFSIGKGELFAVVGESGSGKSITALSIMSLLPRGFRISSGSVRFFGEELAGASQRRMMSLRGDRIAMIFQDPLTALNPLLTIGFQISESLVLHRHVSKKEGLDRAAELLEKVGIPDGRDRLSSYPHQLSGGMRQRVMIASAVSCEPDLLIADEPTTALDVTVQASIMRLIKRLCSERGTALMLISHNLSLVRNTCSKVAVMYSGSVQEACPSAELFERPLHPYTRMLIECLPKIDGSERLKSIGGSPPSPAMRPAGCPFNPRCPSVMDVCRERVPDFAEVSGGHFVRCFLYDGKTD